jgi:hypothetical protein
VWAAELCRLLARSILDGRPGPELAALDAARFGPRADDPAWVRDAGRRRFADYYGLDRAAHVAIGAGPSVEHYAWK